MFSPLCLLSIPSKLLPCVCSLFRGDQKKKKKTYIINLIASIVCQTMRAMSLHFTWTMVMRASMNIIMAHRAPDRLDLGRTCLVGSGLYSDFTAQIIVRVHYPSLPDRSWIRPDLALKVDYRSNSLDPSHRSESGSPYTGSGGMSGPDPGPLSPVRGILYEVAATGTTTCLVGGLT